MSDGWMVIIDHHWSMVMVNGHGSFNSISFFSLRMFMLDSQNTREKFFIFSPSPLNLKCQTQMSDAE